MNRQELDHFRLTYHYGDSDISVNGRLYYGIHYYEDSWWLAIDPNECADGPWTTKLVREDPPAEKDN